MSHLAESVHRWFLETTIDEQRVMMADKSKGDDGNGSDDIGGANNGKAKIGVAFELGRHGWPSNNDCEDDEDHADEGNGARPAQTLDRSV